LAAIAGILGFVGSLVPGYGALAGLPAPIAVWVGRRCRRIGPPASAPAPRWARRSASVGIVFGVLGTCMVLMWCGVMALIIVFRGDPFRGL
jgi:hypothetical protein